LVGYTHGGQHAVNGQCVLRAGAGGALVPMPMLVLVPVAKRLCVAMAVILTIAAGAIVTMLALLRVTMLAGMRVAMLLLVPVSVPSARRGRRWG